MPTKEKDKILLRLIAKDKVLVDKLHYELLEEGLTLDDRREEIRDRIERSAQGDHGTPGWLMMDMRDISGMISYHVKVTKDKPAALDMNLFLLLRFMEENQNMLRTYSSRADKCALYLAKKAQTVINAFNRLDPDYRIDYISDLNRMLTLLFTLCSKGYAQQLGLPRDIQS